MRARPAAIGIAFLFALPAVLLTGCVPPPLVTGLAVTPVPASGAIDAAALLQPHAATCTFVDAGDENAAPVTVTRAATERYRAEWETAFADEHTEYWIVQDDGAIAVTAIVDHAQHAISAFDPPLLLMPATLEAETEVVAQSSMRVLDSRNLRKVRESGTARRTITWTGDALVPTPAGAQRAHVLRIQFDADLRLATATDVTTLYVAPEFGTILRLEDRTITALGIPVTTQRELRQSRPPEP